MTQTFINLKMNNNIEEKYVSFEVAKLLNNVGCILQSEKRYNKQGAFKYSKAWSISAPTVGLAIDWIRENFNLHIYTDYNKIHKWWYCINNLNDNDRMDASQFISSEEAEHAALLYALKNLTDESYRAGRFLGIDFPYVAGDPEF